MPDVVYENNRNHKTDYSVEKLIEEAKLLNNLFDGIINDEAKEPIGVYRTLLEHHELTIDQKTNLERVAKRVWKAKRIVDYLKEKYPLKNVQSNTPWIPDDFDSDALCRLLSPENAPNNKFYTKSLSFQIGLFLPDSYFKTNVRGDAPLYQGEYRLPIGFILDNLISKIETDSLDSKDGGDIFDAIFFRVNHRDILLGTEFPWVRHELKHKIDLFLIGYQLLTPELSADLYTSSSEYGNSIERDIIVVKRMLSSREKRYQELEAKNTPGFLLTNETNKIAEYGDAINTLENFSVDAVDSILANGLDSKLLSYIVAMTPCVKLPHRLELINDYLKRNPIRKDI